MFWIYHFELSEFENLLYLDTDSVMQITGKNKFSENNSKLLFFCYLHFVIISQNNMLLFRKQI